MINIIKLGYVPHACCWVHGRGQVQGLLAMSVFTAFLASSPHFFVDLIQNLEQYVSMMVAVATRLSSPSRVYIASQFMSLR